MTVKEKRKALDLYCDKTTCEKCVIGGKEVCRCGCGAYFTNPPEDDNGMSDAEIIGAYEMVFGSTETAFGSTETAVADNNSITISGIDKIQAYQFISRRIIKHGFF